MRNIEREMVHAATTGSDWGKSNTKVKRVGDTSEIYLHDNHIATMALDYDRTVTVNVETLRRWPTPTTKSRLRALRADVMTKKNVTYLNGEPI